MQAQVCLFCGHTVQLIAVHGHYQCPVCNTNALPCCDGDNCHTNQLLDLPTEIKNHPVNHPDGSPYAPDFTGKRFFLRRVFTAGETLPENDQ